jgi:AcrR family transcriptional regulator
MAKKLSTKEQIIQKAGEHFSRYGYEATHLEKIAKECGISKPAIYYHFKDKAALYEAVLYRGFSELASAIKEKTGQDDPEIQLAAYIRTFGDYLIATPSFSAIFSREIANDAKSLPESCIAELAQTLESLLEILKKGESQGVFHCKNPFTIQMMIVTTLSAYLTTASLRQKVSQMIDSADAKKLDPHIDDIIENLTQKILKGLKC